MRSILYNAWTVLLFAVGLILTIGLSGAPAIAASGSTKELKHGHWSFSGPFGSYDKESVQRGFQVYREVCAACHSIDYLSFRNFGEKGGPFHLNSCPAGAPAELDCSNPNDNPIVKALAAEYEVEDGPDDSGDIFTRPGLPSDRIPGPYANDMVAKAANRGALPPDLSLIAKARHHGPDYIYSLLTGYGEVPEEITLLPGQYYNPYYPGDTKSLMKAEYFDENGDLLPGVQVPYGGAFAMASPLVDGIVEYYGDDTPETIEQYSKDVAYFLMWAAEPKLEARKRMGLISLFYLLILAGIVYASYRQIWSKMDK